MRHWNRKILALLPMLGFGLVIVLALAATPGSAGGIHGPGQSVVAMPTDDPALDGTGNDHCIPVLGRNCQEITYGINPGRQIDLPLCHRSLAQLAAALAQAQTRLRPDAPVPIVLRQRA